LNVDIFVAWDPFIAAKFSSEYDSVDITSEYEHLFFVRDSSF